MAIPTRYLYLLNEIHELTLLPKAVLSRELTHLSIRGVEFSMYPVDDQDHVVIHCEFGALPDSRREEVLTRLLDTNFHMLNSAKPVTFCRNEYNGRMLLSMVQPLSGLSGQGVLDQMGVLADYALAWRQNYFLAAVPDVRPPSASQTQLSAAARSWGAI